MIKVENHLIVDPEGKTEISFEETPNISGPFKNGLPDTVVIHYTAGSSLDSSATWLKNPAAKASAHLVVGKTGRVIQLAPFNIRTWHAGRSSWKGRTGLNQYSIGIELDNAGLLQKSAEGYLTSFNKKISDSSVVLAQHKFGNEEKAWEAFLPKQIEVVEQICLALKEAYNISEILGHDDVAPTRKVDPGPAFPLVALQNTIFFGRDEDLDVPEDEEILAKGIVTADNLNIRTDPGMESLLVSNPLPRGTKLDITQTAGEWMYVKTSVEGWVSKKWVNVV